jgi:hypothetical protein
MKLRLLQPGYENMDGYIGIIEFKDGLSVDDVNEREARQLGLSIRVEFEDGRDPNPAQNLLDSMHNQAPVAGEEPAEPVEPEVPVALLTREDLEAVADKGGIKGLRAIAEGFNVKGTSIVELINEILEAQAASQPAEQTPEAPVEVPAEQAPEAPAEAAPEVPAEAPAEAQEGATETEEVKAE